MECNQKETAIAMTRTLYENFIEEKSECDLLIPDYFPAAEKVIQCCVTPSISKKEIEGDRLYIEGICKFTVLYQGEDEAGIKLLSESVSFSETFTVKDANIDCWVQTVMRASGTSCRLLNPRKISARSLISIALKVKKQDYTETIEMIECEKAEALFDTKSVYTVLEHVADTIKVQGEIEVHTDIQDVLKAEGVVCIKDIKIIGGKAMVKGVLNLFLLFTPEEDPCRVEQTSTAIPFSQLIELEGADEAAFMDPTSYIQNIRTDVETDEDGKNRLISVVTTILTEGEVFVNREHQLLMDAYSNQYPVIPTYESVSMETIIDQSECSKSLTFEMNTDGEQFDIIQIMGVPIVRKIAGEDKSLVLSGVLDVSMFVFDGQQYRNIDKSFPFTLKKEMDRLDGQLRCEARPCLLGIDYTNHGNLIEIKAEMQCYLTVYRKETIEIITELRLDTEHPLGDHSKCGLVVYFGEKGERLWDIARRYATSVSVLKQLNDLGEDVLNEKKLLLISR